MIQVKAIELTTHGNSTCNISRLREVTEKALSKVASATQYEVFQSYFDMTFRLNTSIGLSTIIRLLSVYQRNGLSIEKVEWNKNLMKETVGTVKIKVF